jgi:hypothetical protein
MGYKSRKKYISRRDKFQEALRSTRIIFIFITIALVMWVFINRNDYWAWIKTYFY